MWTFSLSVIVTEKVEMTTTNEKIKKIYDSYHEVASNGNLKRHDHEKRLNLSDLFNCENELSVTPIAGNFIVTNIGVPDRVRRNTACLTFAIETKWFLRHESYSTMEELQLNQIINDLYINIISNEEVSKSNELHLIQST